MAKKLYKVSGWKTVTKYVDIFVQAENEEDAGHKAWSGDYIDEFDQGEDEGDLEITEIEEVDHYED
jgi:hypothetical protein